MGGGVYLFVLGASSSDAFSGLPLPSNPPLSEVLRIVALIEQFHTFILLYDTEYDEYTIHTYMSVDLLVR